MIILFILLHKVNLFGGIWAWKDDWGLVSNCRLEVNGLYPFFGRLSPHWMSMYVFFTCMAVEMGILTMPRLFWKIWLQFITISWFIVIALCSSVYIIMVRCSSVHIIIVWCSSVHIYIYMHSEFYIYTHSELVHYYIYSELVHSCTLELVRLMHILELVHLSWYLHMLTSFG